MKWYQTLMNISPYKKSFFTLLFSLFLTLLSFTWMVYVSADETAKKQTILVSVDRLVVTDKDLEEALRSSPFYTQFNTMNEQEQGSLRGNTLKRLVAARLLSLEANATQLGESPAFKKELNHFRNGLLYRYYMDKLRSRIKIPEEKLVEMRQQYKGNRDAFSAEKASYRSSQYRSMYQLTIKTLRDKFHVVLHDKKVKVGAPLETVVLEGDNGIKLTMADVLDSDNKTTYETKDQLLEQIYKLAELQVVAKAADDENIDVSKQIADYIQERLPALFIEQKHKKWAGNDEVLKAYFKSHPEAAFIPQRWHLGMIVLKTKEEADMVLSRINQGESLFKLAGELSIDPYGKKKFGDMGWVRERSGNPVIENAIKDLPEGKMSKVIKTKKGFIIATIFDRRPGGIRRFESMKDKIKQLVINENMRPFLQGLQQKYKVDWKLLNDNSKKIAPIKEAKVNG